MFFDAVVGFAERGPGVKATGSLTFTGTDCVGFVITIGNKALREAQNGSKEWIAQGTTAGNATQIANAINTFIADTGATAVASSSTVNITATTGGVAGNSLVITVSTGGQTSQSGATLSGGSD